MKVTAQIRRKKSGARHSEQGYALLIMLLAVALMTIAALAALPDLIFELKRDQEQEMIHRGVQYTRAIRAYYRKFGRYPSRMEDLDNSNNMRFLRKHYKDPLTGKDFKLLHYGDPGLQLTGGTIGGGMINGATPAGAAMNGPGGSASGGSAFGGSSSGFGGSGFGNSSFGNSSFGGSGFGNNNNGVNSNGAFSQSSSFGGSSNSGFGSNSNSQNNPQQNNNSTSSTDATQATAGVAGNGDQSDASSSGQQVSSGGALVGVASTSKKTTIREFNKKKKYNEWQFIYDPTADRGGLIKTPYQPPLQGMMNNSLMPGQNGMQPGSNNNSPFGGSNGSSSPFGQSSGFGSSSGFGQSSGFGSSGFGNNNSNSGGSGPPPSSNPNQQQ
jgi:type II secretory pathway pseudopilin PulG